jgi:hypothetical protein
MGVLNSRHTRRLIPAAVTLILLAAVVLTLIHWHQDSDSQRCEICFARQLPSIHVPFAAWLAVPTRVEWRSPIEKPATVRTASFRLHTSRAPPLIASF